jgi:hypothetical protein
MSGMYSTENENAYCPPQITAKYIEEPKLAIVEIKPPTPVLEL